MAKIDPAGQAIIDEYLDCWRAKEAFTAKLNLVKAKLLAYSQEKKQKTFFTPTARVTVTTKQRTVFPKINQPGRKELEQVVAVLDFEEAEENRLLLDWARLVLAIAQKDNGMAIDKQRAELILEGYEQQRGLEPAEKANLWPAVRYVAGGGAIWLWNHDYREYAHQYISRGKSV